MYFCMYPGWRQFEVGAIQSEEEGGQLMAVKQVSSSQIQNM